MNTQWTFDEESDDGEFSLTIEQCLDRQINYGAYKHQGTYRDLVDKAEWRTYARRLLKTSWPNDELHFILETVLKYYNDARAERNKQRSNTGPATNQKARHKRNIV